MNVCISLLLAHFLPSPHKFSPFVLLFASLFYRHTGLHQHNVGVSNYLGHILHHSDERPHLKIFCCLGIFEIGFYGHVGFEYEGYV